MPHIPAQAARLIETPAATMRTYASPSTDASAPLAVWRTEMAADAAGPVHTIDRDQVVVVVSGHLEAEVEGVVASVPAGDALLVPAGSTRRLAAGGGEPLITVTASLPGAVAAVGGGDPVPVPWAR